jgi:hypothetical protein
VFPNIKWLRITPDRTGTGGTKTGFHSFQQTPINDVRSLKGAHLYQGAWRRDFDPVEYPAEVIDRASLGCLQIHGYTYPSLTDPAAAPTIKILLQNITAGASKVYETDGTSRQGRPGTNQAGTFINIAGRCVFGEGAAEALLMDSRTPAIHAQPNQKLGVEAPPQPLSLAAGVSYTPSGTAYSTYNSKFVNSPNPNNRIWTIPTTDTVALSFPNAGLSGPGYFVGNPASGVVDVAGKTSNTSTFTAAGTISITTGTSKVTCTSAWPADGEYCGLTINFNGYSFVIAETLNGGGNWDLNGNAITLTNKELLLLGVYNGPTVSGISYTITGSQIKLHTASTCLMNTKGNSGYGQTTLSNLVQCLVLAVKSDGLYRNLGNISLGPESAALPSIAYANDLSMIKNSTHLVSSSNPFLKTDVGKSVAVALAGTAGATLVTTISTFISSNEITLALPAKATVNPTEGWWGNWQQITDGAMNIGSTTLTSASNPFLAGDVGQMIIVDGAGSVTGDALVTTIAGFTNTGQITLADANASGLNLTGKYVWWRGVSRVVTEGPTYAYAWYDPETGHMSNISPLFTIPKPVNQGSYGDFANLTPMFNIDPGQIAYPEGYNVTTPTGDAIRFSHIMFFRTLSTPGSSTLYPIGSLMPFVGKVHPGSASTRGTTNPGQLQGWMGMPNSWVIPGAVAGQQWYDFSSDSDLLLSGGFRAPQYTNSKPMALLRGGVTQPGYPFALAYWDRRLWVVNTQEPNKIMFSCDDAQCPLGVPEESFPPTNFLRLPSASDGKVTGMRTIGDMLLITTQRFAYIVAGNNESNYRLMKVSSSMPGVGTYQMDEFPTYTGAEGEPTTVFYLGTDRIVYQWTVGRQVVPISMGIQDQLDALLSQAPMRTVYLGSRVHCVSAWGRRLVVVAPYYTASQTAGLPTFIYDVTEQTWSTSYRGDGPSNAGLFSGTAPMTTVYGAANVPVNELYAIYTGNPISGVHAMSWIRDDSVNCTFPMQLSTFPLTFDGKKVRKQIVAVNIHATSGTWTGALAVNDQNTSTFTFATFPDPIYSIYAPTGVQGIVDDVVAQDLVCMAGQFLTDGTPMVGYRFAVTVEKKNPDLSPATLYAIDVGYIDWENPGEGDP